MKKAIHHKGHQPHRTNIDGLGTIGIIFGIACISFILYNVFHVIFS